MGNEKQLTKRGGHLRKKKIIYSRNYDFTESVKKNFQLGIFESIEKESVEKIKL